MPRRKRPVLGVDYIVDPDGSAQFTREYLLKRADCCEHECRYCPFHNSTGKPDENKASAPSQFTSLTCSSPN